MIMKSDLLMITGKKFNSTEHGTPILLFISLIETWSRQFSFCFLCKLKDFWSAAKKAGNTDCCTVLLVLPLICLWGSIDFEFVCWSCCCRYNIYQSFTSISLHEYSAIVLYNLFTNIGDKILKSIKKHHLEIFLSENNLFIRWFAWQSNVL
jgi:hypothetical protein